MASSGENRRYYNCYPLATECFYNALGRYLFKFLLSADGTRGWRS